MARKAFRKGLLGTLYRRNQLNSIDRITFSCNLTYGNHSIYVKKNETREGRSRGRPEKESRQDQRVVGDPPKEISQRPSEVSSRRFRGRASFNSNVSPRKSGVSER